MSLSIDIDRIESVLLVDGWHEVDWEEGISTFLADAYEYLWEDDIQAGHPDCSTGFGFRSGGHWVYGPLTAIQAVKIKA